MNWAGQVMVLGREKVRTGFRWGNLMERDRFRNLLLDWRIVLIWILKKWNGGMGWIDLDQYRDRWQALVKAIMNLQLP
jgi:hypothetical protein